jgi:hypothetical protein
LRRITVVLTALLAVASIWLATSAALSQAAGSNAEGRRYLHRQLLMFQRSTWRWQRVMGLPLAHTYGRVLAGLSIRDAQAAVALWHRRALTARRRAQHPPHLRDWLCIHRYEASWTDGGAPYYGGLQMNYGFMHHYAPALLRSKGTADHWTPLEQIWVAEKARRSGRGFWPWPNTARACGLL